MDLNMVDNSIHYATEQQDNADDICNMINTEDLLTFSESQSLALESFVSFDNEILIDNMPASQASAEEPEHWNKFPNMEPVETKYAFDMHIEPGHNPHWMYNSKMDKVYIRSKCIMKVAFSYKPVHNQSSLSLRAMILFTSPDEMHLQAKRCASHRVSKDSEGVPVEHILKCSSPGTQYVGNENGTIFGQRLSIIVPLGRPVLIKDGRAYESITLEFLCHNSCSTGINRKTTAVVFTLEDELCNIIGKKVMPFKVCSCPKRDMERDNSTQVARKRKSNAPNGKRPLKVPCLEEVKVEPPTPSPDTSGQPYPHTDPYPITFTLTMPNKQSMKLVLQCALNAIELLMVNKDTVNKYLKYARSIKGFLDAYSADDDN